MSLQVTGKDFIKKIFISGAAVFFTCFFQAFSQSPASGARAVIDTLCSQAFAGRGYQDSGDVKAALFIEQKFRTAGLAPIPGAEDFMLPVRFSINTFPATPSLRLNGKQAVLARDFLPAASSSSARGKRGAVMVDESNLLDFTDTQLRNFINKKFLIYKTPAARRVFEEMAGDYLVAHRKNYRWAMITDGLTGTVATHQSPDLGLLIHKNFIKDESKKIRVKYDVESEYRENITSYNVAGYVKGALYPDSLVVVTAHYDHLGRIGKMIFPGAHDNAAGVALMLELMKHFTGEGNRPACSMVFVAFTGEEAGLLGSHEMVLQKRLDLKKISFLLNLDLVGTCKDGLMVVNGLTYLSHYEKLREINAAGDFFENIKARGRAANSDHFHFSEQGVPSFFIYGLDASYTCYHHPCDNAENLPLSGFGNLFLLCRDFLSYFAY